MSMSKDEMQYQIALQEISSARAESGQYLTIVIALFGTSIAISTDMGETGDVSVTNIRLMYVISFILLLSALLVYKIMKIYNMYSYLIREWGIDSFPILGITEQSEKSVMKIFLCIFCIVSCFFIILVVCRFFEIRFFGVLHQAVYGSLLIVWLAIGFSFGVTTWISRQNRNQRKSAWEYFNTKTNKND